MSVNNDPKLLKQELRRAFGFDGFLTSEQEAATEAVYKADRDVYINFHPGAGKSLCYQLPTIVKPFKITIIFMPNGTLVKDQIDCLNGHGIGAKYLNLSTSERRSKDLLASLDKLGDVETTFRFLFVTLGNFVSESATILLEIMKKLVQANALGYVVFDEAHSVSRLSHHYIPGYFDAAKLVRSVCERIPKIALTGTATREVRRDIIEGIGMRGTRKFVTHSYNQSVYHEVHSKDIIAQPVEHLGKFISDRIVDSNESSLGLSGKCGIIFCRNKQDIVEIVNDLGAIDIPVAPYHGGMPLKTRIAIHERWKAGEIPVIAVTRQFGVGLRGRDVTFVVHWGMPMSLQQMIQESGRVNQDGRPAYCRLYFSYAEEMHITAQIQSAFLRNPADVVVMIRHHRFFHEVINYCLQPLCRHIAQRAYFGQAVVACEKYCDVCGDQDHCRRVEKLLRYRHSMKLKMAYPPELTVDYFLERNRKMVVLRAHLWAMVPRSTHSCTALRKKLLEKLQEALTRNYETRGFSAGQSVGGVNPRHVARQLEYMVYKSSIRPHRYIHKMNEMVEIIKTCTNFELVCGYLKLYQALPSVRLDTDPGDVAFMDVDDEESAEYDRFFDLTEIKLRITELELAGLPEDDKSFVPFVVRPKSTRGNT